MESGQDRLKRILAEAVARADPAARAAYLQEACAGDSLLHSKVGDLIEAYESRGSEFDQMLAMAKPLAESPGAMIGHYRLLEQIGEGGFGIVFMAEQTEPIRRRVALKIIKPGMDTKQAIARFEAERQALAMMDHPNIAQVFDAGATEAGRPFFVMELVHGVPITDFCDANEVVPKERLRLFITVCEAVQHAHQKGIIHRDLKPSNILVMVHDGKPVPKVIDFGTAKALQQPLTEKTLFTGYGKLLGTPHYMSPEQAEMSGLDVDTRADIYALGVLLYELLTGTTPFEAERLRTAAFVEMMRIIREEEPPRPSTRVLTLGARATEIAKHRQMGTALLCRTLRGDLDWILMKALEKDRTRRYQTANTLAEDLQRHLDHHPVHAGPPGTAYRVRKFIRCHRLGVVVAATVAAAVIAGLAFSLVGFARASHERDRAVSAEVEAERQRNRAETALAQSQESLWQANFERAQALRRSRMPGQRVRALSAIRAAAATRLSPELRTEAIAALSLADLEDMGLWQELPANPIRPIAVDGECLRFAVALSGGQVEVRSLLDNDLKAKFTNAPLNVEGLRFDRAGSRLAAAGNDRSLVWDVLRQKTLLEDSEFSFPAISDDGRLVVRLARSRGTMVWDLEERRELSRLEPRQQPRRAAFSPDGQRVLLFSRPFVEVWRWRNGQKEAELRLPSGSLGLAWSGDGAALGIGCEDRNLYIWRPPEAQPRKILGHRQEGVRPFYHPSGDLLASVAWDATLRLWDTDTGMQWLESGIDAPLRFSADGQWLAVQRSGAVGRFRVHPADICRSLPTGSDPSLRLEALSFSPDSRSLVGLQSGQTFIWDLASCRMVLRQYLRDAISVHFLGATQLLTANAAEVLLWTNLGSPSEWQLSAPTTVVRPGGVIRGCELSADLRSIVLAVGQEGRVYDLPTGSSPTSTAGLPQSGTAAPPVPYPLVEPRLRLLGQPLFGKAAFSQDGQWIASGYWIDEPMPVLPAMWFWAVADGRPVHQIPLRKCTPYFSPDGRWFLTMTFDESRVYAIDGPPEKWRQAWRRRGENATYIIQGAAFSSDSTRLALAAGFSDIRILATATGQELARLTPPDPWIWALAWSPDDRWLAVTSDSSVFLWDMHLLHTRLRELGLDWE